MFTAGQDGEGDLDWGKGKDPYLDPLYFGKGKGKGKKGKGGKDAYAGGKKGK